MKLQTVGATGKMLAHLTYANVMATIAVFITLGGVGYAATKLPANSVGTKQLVNKSITLPKVAPAARAALKGERGKQGLRGKPGAQGTPGVLGSPGPTGPSDTYTLQNGDVTVTDADGVTDVADLAVPAGTYLLNVSLLVNNNGANSAPVVCYAKFATGDSQSFRTSIAASGDGDLRMQNLSFVATGTQYAATTPISLECSDHTNVTTDSITFDQYELVATKVGALHVSN